MIGLDRLMKIRGVVAAGQFDLDGKMIRKVGEIPERVREQIAKMNAEQTENFRTTAQTFHQLTNLEWTPMIGWMMWGGKYALCVVNNNCLIVEAKYADFNQLMVDLFGSEPTGGKPLLSGL